MHLTTKETALRYPATRLLSTLLLGTALLSFCTAAHAAETLPLKRVVITASGLALYEHQGTVDGNENIEIPVQLDRVDDMLKSLVVLDARGQLGGVSLPGREPLSQTFRNLPFSQSDLDSLIQLLNTLRGADVQTDSLQGRLMNVTDETEQTKEGGLIIRHRVSILTPEGIKTAVLENIGRLQFSDKGVQDQLNRALEALFTNRIKDQRTLTISLRGEGSRPVSLAYIQDAPLWKSSYRLVLPHDDKEGKAVLQGWAVLENTTGQDWKNVSVTLMSGSPVTYQQALYESYYLSRPELPVKVMDRILPRIDNGALAQAADMEGDKGALRQEKMGMMAPMKQKSLLKAEGRAMGGELNEDRPSEMMAMDAMEGAPGMSGTPMPAMSAPMAPPAPMALVSTAAADETASQMVFAFPQPVDLPAGNSLMIPFISREFSARKVWVYQPETNSAHPLSAVSFKNDGSSGLPPGILTLYDRAESGLLHVGDADMPLVPKGEDRYISFALDTKTKIDQQSEDDRQLGLITVSKGLLHQKVIWRNTTSYTAKAPEDESRTIVIEQPRREGWEIIKPDNATEEPEVTSTHYRVKMNVDAGKSETMKLTLQRQDTETIALTQISAGDLEARMAAVGKNLPSALRRALERVKELQANVYAPQAQLNSIAAQRQNLYNDQQRLRENLKTVSTNTPLGKRYLKNLEDQENQLDLLAGREQDLTTQIQKARAALNDYVAALEL